VHGGFSRLVSYNNKNYLYGSKNVFIFIFYIFVNYENYMLNVFINCSQVFHFTTVYITLVTV